mgnify:CR=1 FL=1
MKEIKIYKLIDPITNLVMYVGQTKKSKCSRLSIHRYDARNKDKVRDLWIRDLLLKGLDPIFEVIEIANEFHFKEREIFWILYYRKLNPLLTNITNGGKHLRGEEKNKERSKKISDNKSKSVYQLDLNFNIIGEFLSCKEASKFTNLFDCNINHSAKSNGKFIAGGFVWIYKSNYEEWKNNNNFLCYKKNTEYLFNKVSQYTKDGNFIKEFESVKSAAKELGFKPQGITKARIGHRKTYMGFIWK